MKICHFIASKGLGRGEAYIDLCNALQKSGMDITLLVPKGALYLERIDENINVFEYKSKNSRYNPLLFIELFFVLKRINAELVHTHFAKATQIFYNLNTFLNIPYIATKHNPRKGKIFNKVPRVIAVSKGVAESIKNSNISVVYNGIEPIALSQKKDNLSIFTLCAIGRLDPIKGFDILIKECAKLSFDFQLVIIGDGSEKNNLQSLIDSLGLENKIFLRGFQKNIPQIMADCDMVIQSSHSEGFSLVMVEALFYAKIFVCTKVSGAVEILDDNFLIDHQNIARKIEEIYQNYEMYAQQFKDIQHKRRASFTLKNICKEYHNLYRNIQKENI